MGCVQPREDGKSDWETCDRQGWDTYSNSQTWNQKTPFLQSTCHLVHKAGNGDVQEALSDSKGSMSIRGCSLRSPCLMEEVIALTV